MESPNSMVSTLYIFTPFDDVMGWVLLFSPLFSPLFSHGGQVQFLLSREPFCLITAACRFSSLPPIPSVCPSPKLHWLSTFSHSTHAITLPAPPSLTARVSILCMLGGLLDMPEVRQPAPPLCWITAPCQHRPHYRPKNVVSSSHFEGKGSLSLFSKYHTLSWSISLGRCSETKKKKT